MCYVQEGGGNINVMSGEIECIFLKTQKKFWRLKYNIWSKNTLKRMHIRLNITNKNISEFKDVAIEMISNEGKRQKQLKKMKRISVTHGTISSSLTFVYLEFQRRRGRDEI